MDKDIIDFGSINLPESWNDVTLGVYQKIERYYSDKDREKDFDILDVIDIFIGKDRDYVMQLPQEFLQILLDKLAFLEETPKTDKPTNKIEISGETYIINVQNKLKTGEWIATDTILKDDRHNYAAILGILCRKEGELYDSRFENEVLEDRIKMFEEQPITKILPIIAFFLNLSVVLGSPTLLSSKVKEEINRIVSNIETLQKNGEVSKRYMRSVTKKLKKLEKSINFT